MAAALVEIPKSPNPYALGSPLVWQTRLVVPAEPDSLCAAHLQTAALRAVLADQSTPTPL